MLKNIPGNIAKHSGECRQTFWIILLNIPGNVAKHSGGILLNILENVTKHSAECCRTFWGISWNISGNILNILGISWNIMGNVTKHSGECPQSFGEWDIESVLLEFHVLLLGFLLGKANVKKRGDGHEKKFFMNNTVQALILLKESHRGLLKLHLQLGEGVLV